MNHTVVGVRRISANVRCHWLRLVNRGSVLGLKTDFVPGDLYSVVYDLKALMIESDCVCVCVCM